MIYYKTKKQKNKNKQFRNTKHPKNIELSIFHLTDICWILQQQLQLLGIRMDCLDASLSQIQRLGYPAIETLA